MEDKKKEISQNLQNQLATYEHEYYLLKKRIKQVRRNINEINGAITLLKQLEK